MDGYSSWDSGAKIVYCEYEVSYRELYIMKVSNTKVPEYNITLEREGTQSKINSWDIAPYITWERYFHG